MGSDRSLENPTGSSSCVVISFIRSISIVSSSSGLESEENFLNGLRSSFTLDEEHTGVEVAAENTVVREEVAETTVTGFTGESASRGLGGDKSRLSFRGAQLTGTLKQSSSFLPLSEYPLSWEFVSKSSGGDGLCGEVNSLLEGDTNCRFFLRGLKLRFLLTVFCTSWRGLARGRGGIIAVRDGE